MRMILSASPWVDAKLEILRLWWKSCENPTEQDLDELIDKLWMFEQEIVKLRREQDAAAADVKVAVRIEQLPLMAVCAKHCRRMK